MEYPLARQYKNDDDEHRSKMKYIPMACNCIKLSK